MADESRLDDLASKVAEGSAVDWDSAEQDARDGSERAVVRELHVLAKMTDAVRSPLLQPVTETPRSAAELQAGQLWGHLRISEVLGEGSFGCVYRAWDTRLECDVALKLTKAPDIDRAFDMSRAIKEARLLARVRHNNVVRVFGADSHAGRFGLWMELVTGRTLQQVLTMHGPMGASEATPIGIDLCHALAAVHGAGLLHRDIKANNVVREAGGRIVLMDFGTGRDIGRSAGMTDSMAGTPLYLAPELFSGENPSVASDIYSLGVLLYHLVTNDYPVRGSSRADVEASHRTAKRQPLRDARPDLPPAFIDVVERALSRHPADRNKSAGELGNALSAIAGLPYARDAEPSPNRWRKWQVAVAAVAVAGMLAALSIFSSRIANQPNAAATDVTSANSPPTQTVAGKTPEAASTSFSVMASFHASRDGRDVRLSQGSRVRPGDKLFAVMNSSKPVFVYIINRDDAGQSFLLFPLPGFTPGNPIPTSQMNRFPGARNGQQHYWEVTSAGGQEHFLLYVSPHRLVEFEQLIAALPRAEVGRSVSSVPLSTADMGILRGVGGLSAATSTPAPSTGTEPADLLPLSDQSESVVGLWARRVSFLNPAE